ncbi:ABC transporter permease [Chloroflexota bacterium]
MHKALVIFKHEFVHQVTRSGFIVMTVMFPLIALLAIGIYQLVQVASVEGGPDDIQKIGYVDETAIFLHPGKESQQIVLLPFPDYEDAGQALLAEEIDEFIVIPADYLDTGHITRYHLTKELEMSGTTYSVIRDFLQANLLAEVANPEISERVRNPLGVNSIRLDTTGTVAADQGGVGAFILPMAFGFLLVISIGASAGYLLQGMGEEKENRIIEILVSSVSPVQLLIGKVLGLGVAGLLQVLVWLVAVVLIARLAADTIGGFFTSLQVPDNFMLLGITYFILGYLFFSVMIAGIGAISANPKDSPQISVAFILPAILPFYVSMLFLQDNPDHVIGTIFTLIPVTAPMSVFVRLGTSEIATWELAASICILLLSIVGAVFLAAKTFRIFLLMYGKTPRLKEIFRLLRQA